MAHTTQGKTCTFIHNGGYHGDVTIICNTLADSGEQFQVDFQDILNFVADYIISEKISKLEQMTAEELFKDV